MKKILLLVSVMMLFIVSGCGPQRLNKKRADKNTQEFYYDIEAIRNKTVAGSIDVKVWSYGADIQSAKEQATKNAVHAALFRGLPGNAAERVTATPPIIRDLSTEENYATFFESFLKEHGPYMRYATKNNSAQTMDIVKLANFRTKIHKYKYKVGVIVTIQYDQLKKMLENEGIIKSMRSGFAM